jgi:voltage-gated potassium channel
MGRRRFSGDKIADLKLRGVLLVIVFVAAAASFAGAVFVRLVDPGIGSFGDALWWSVATVTTTGFGDVVPTDPPGRVVGVILMFIGISLIPTVTSLIVAVFVAQRSREAAAADRVSREEVMDRLDRLEAHIDALAARDR